MQPLHRAPCFRAYHGPLATRIEERPMPVRRTERRMKRMGNLPGPAQQLDLFGDDRPRTIVDTPAWPATVSRPVQKDDMPAASTRVARPIERGTVTSPLQRERQSASRP